MLRRHGHVTLAAATAALAVGANLVIFAFINALWFRPSQVRDERSLFLIAHAGQASDPSRWTELGMTGLASTGLFSSLAGEVVTTGLFVDLKPRIVIGPVGREVETLAVSRHYFSTLGVPVLGRDFSSAGLLESPIAVISYRLWRSYFGGDPAVIGSTIAARPVDLLIVGIAAEGFEGALRGQRADLWISSRALPAITGISPARSIPMATIARLAPGVTPAGALAWFARAPRKRDADIRLIPIRRVFSSAESPTVIFDEKRFMAVVGATAVGVFIAGLFTVISLLVVHYERRRVEIAIRIALGATTASIVRLVARELAIVTAASVAASMLAARWLIAVVPKFHLSGSVDFSTLDLSFDWRLYIVAILGCGITVFGAALPLIARMAVRLRRTNFTLAAGLTGGGIRLRRTALGLHAAVTVVVVTLAALFVQTVRHELSEGVGFDASNTTFVTIRMAPRAPERAERETARDVRSAREFLDAMRTLSNGVALGPSPLDSRLQASLSAVQRIESGSIAVEAPVAWLQAGTGYLDALGVESLEGREGGRNEAVVTPALAREIWGAPELALGQPLRYGPFHGTVTGVANLSVGSARARHANAIVTFDADNLLDGVIRDRRELSVAIRSSGASPVRGIEEIARSIFSDSTKVQIQTGSGQVADDLARERMGGWYFSGLAAVAVALGLGSIFGLVTYSIAIERRIYGIMLALGASSRALVLKAIGVGAVPVALGVLAGEGAAVIAGIFASHLIAGVSTSDYRAYLFAAGGFLTVALVAAALAATSVRRLDPITILRSE